MVLGRPCSAALAAVRDAANDPTVVIDCRWLNIGGPGRTTELLLRGLAEDPPPGDWVLWGRERATGPLAWPTARSAPVDGDPRLLVGQRHTFDVPFADIVLFMHQQRPLRNVPSVTLIYDTIPLRYGGGRALKRLFLRRIAAGSRRILTISDHSKASIVRDLAVSASRVEVVRFPFDTAFVERVLDLRRTTQREPVALYVGAFLGHKNLPRLLAAFESTQFCRDGGRLLLVGGTPRQAKTLLGRLTPGQRAPVSVRHACGQDELDRLFASSLLLVQPSLEEGFGLPAWEALCCGLPVCSSDGGALPEVVRGYAEPFPAGSAQAMASAIDDCARRAVDRSLEDAIAQSDALRRQAPTIRAFAQQFRAVVQRALPREGVDLAQQRDDKGQ